MRSSKLDESLISNYVVTMKYKTIFKLFWVGIRSTNLVILIWIPWPSKVITISIHYFHFYSNNSKKNELNFLIFFCLIRNRFWFWKIFRCTYVPWKPVLLETSSLEKWNVIKNTVFLSRVLQRVIIILTIEYILAFLRHFWQNLGVIRNSN